MPTTVWPVIRLVFRAPLDEATRDRLLLDVDDCAVLALDETADDISLHFGQADQRDAALALLRARGWADVAALEAESVADEGWAARSQAALLAVRVGNVIVAPPWDRPAPDGEDDDLIVIEVEPSTGFGTGHHQSTRLCLRALQTLSLRGGRVLDIGTGSGVLAVAAARLGAAHSLGIDNDPDAIEAAEDTLRRNDVGADGTVQLALRGFDDPGLDPADVVCANLTGALLRAQGARVQALIAPGGCAVLSGFTKDEARWVREAFDQCDVEAELEEEYWIAYVMRRRTSTSQA